MRSVWVTMNVGEVDGGTDVEVDGVDGGVEDIKINVAVASCNERGGGRWRGRSPRIWGGWW